MTDEQKAIYALGLMMQRSLSQFDLSPEELELCKRALTDGSAGKPALDLNEWGPKVQNLARDRAARGITREKGGGSRRQKLHPAKLECHSCPLTFTSGFKDNAQLA